MNKLPVMFVFFIPKVLVAASGTEAHGIPGVVWFQALNFILFVGLLWFLLKDKIKAFYSTKELQFQERFKAASIKKDKALQKLRKLEEKLEEISNTKDAQLVKAKTNASESVQTLLEHATFQVEKIQQESEETSRLLRSKAYEELKKGVIESAIDAVKLELKGKLSKDQHLKLFNEYNKRVSNESIR